MEEKFEWSATLSAPCEYPMQVLSGCIMSDTYSQSFSNWGIINVGWGDGGGMIASSGKKEIPDSLLLLWLSFAEQKFYKGEFELPREKILHYMNKGFMDMDGNMQIKKTYNTFVVGLAAEGRVAVWLADGGQTRQFEIAHFQAMEETGINPEFVPEDDQYIFKPNYISFVMNNEKIMKPEIKERIALHGYPPPETYDYYTKKYLWDLDVRLPAGSVLTHFVMKMCNGEREFTLTDITGSKRSRAIPYLFLIYWKNQEGEEFRSWIVFSKDSLYWKKYSKSGSGYLPLDFAESEIRKLFQQKIKNDISFKMVLNIEPKREDIAIFLEQGTEVYLINEFVSSIKKY